MFPPLWTEGPTLCMQLLKPPVCVTRTTKYGHQLKALMFIIWMAHHWNNQGPPPVIEISRETPLVIPGAPLLLTHRRLWLLAKIAENEAGGWLPCSGAGPGASRVPGLTALQAGSRAPGQGPPSPSACPVLGESSGGHGLTHMLILFSRRKLCS